nr:hypothetical protein [Tanacetum cinerariifolium]
KSHDPLALVAHTGSSSRNTSSYYVTHPTSMVDYDDEYQQDDIQTNSEDPLTSAIYKGGSIYSFEVVNEFPHDPDAYTQPLSAFGLLSFASARITSAPVGDPVESINVPTPSSDPLPSGEDSFTLNELMVFCTNLQEQGRMIEKIDQNAAIAFDDETQGRTNDDEMFGVDDLIGEEVVMDTTTVTTTVKDSAAPTTVVTDDEITIAQALATLKSIEPKVVVQEQEMSTTILATGTTVTTTVPTLRAKGKAKIKEPEVHIKKKDQMRIDKELQAREMEELSEVQKARLFVELTEKRKKHFDALRAQEKRNKPPTKTQMKHMGGYKQSHLKGRSFDEIKKLFDKEIRKVDENVEPVINDSKELKKCIEIVLDDRDEVLIEATPLSSRSPTITDYKIQKEGNKTYFKIIRADEIEVRGRASELAAGSSQATITDSAEVGCSKRAAEAELDYEGLKRQKTNEASGSVREQPDEEENELSQEDL